MIVGPAGVGQSRVAVCWKGDARVSSAPAGCDEIGLRTGGRRSGEQFSSRSKRRAVWSGSRRRRGTRVCCRWRGRRRRLVLAEEVLDHLEVAFERADSERVDPAGVHPLRAQTRRHPVAELGGEAAGMLGSAGTQLLLAAVAEIRFVAVDDGSRDALPMVAPALHHRRTASSGGWTHRLR